MTVNQLHGKKFEDFIKACGLFPGASDSSRTTIADFDIEAKFDRTRNLPTSVKSTGNDTVALADARRFFSIDQDFRMIVGRYEQIDNRKIFAQIYEFILTTATLNALRGTLDLTMVASFHVGIGLGQFPRGSHIEARMWAMQRKIELAPNSSLIVLNPKIDSKSQRRLQCSVRLADLIVASEKHSEFELHTDAIGDFVLPVIQNSARREFTSS